MLTLSRQVRRQRERQAAKDARRAITERAQSRAGFAGSSPRLRAPLPVSAPREHWRIREYGRLIKREATRRLRAEYIGAADGLQGAEGRERLRAWRAMSDLPLDAFVGVLRQEERRLRGRIEAMREEGDETELLSALADWRRITGRGDAEIACILGGSFAAFFSSFARLDRIERRMKPRDSAGERAP